MTLKVVLLWAQTTRRFMSLCIFVTLRARRYLARGDFKRGDLACGDLARGDLTRGDLARGELARWDLVPIHEGETSPPHCLPSTSLFKPCELLRNCLHTV